MVSTITFSRRQYDVEAVQVTAENMRDLAEWCRGSIAKTGRDYSELGSKYIQVPVRRARFNRQTMAFVGDWILRTGNSFKVYDEEALKRDFEANEFGMASDRLQKGRRAVVGVLDEAFKNVPGDDDRYMFARTTATKIFEALGIYAWSPRTDKSSSST